MATQSWLNTVPTSMFLGAAITCSAPLSHAQSPDAAGTFSCAPLSPSRSRNPGYARAHGRPLCEGFFERSVSQPFLELLSLTTGPRPDSAGTAVAVRTAAALPSHLVVQPLRSGPFYRVDAGIGGNPFRWDAGPMLQATGLRWRDLGFLARVIGPASPSARVAYVPVSLVPQPPGGATGSDAGAAPTAGPADAVLRPSVRLSRLAWRMQGGAWQEFGPGTVHAFQRVPLTLAVPAGVAGADVDVQALDADGKPLPMLAFTVVTGADAKR